MMKNEEHEKLLKKFRDMLRHPETDYKKICVGISSKSIALRRSAMKRNIRNASGWLDDGIIVKKNTPPAVSKLTEIASLWDDVSSILTMDKDTLTRSEILKKQKQYDKLVKLVVDFEIDLRHAFENTESLLNALVLNTDNIISFNDILDKAYDSRIILFDELNILKTFNHIRNLFAHNVSYYILVESVTHEDIILYKAVLLEMRDVICGLMDRYKYRLVVFNTYVINTMDKRKMDTLTLLATYEEFLLVALEQENMLGIKISLLELEGLPDGLNVKIKDLKKSK